jgi:hypothetical protein
MLELFQNEIPKLSELTVVLQKLINNSKFTIEEIREVIFDHILECREIPFDDDDKVSEAASLAHTAIDDLINNLEVNKTNYKRIKDYISSYHSYNGFNRLIVDFEGIIPDEERNRLIKDGKRIFVSGITEHWM